MHPDDGNSLEESKEGVHLIFYTAVDSITQKANNYLKKKDITIHNARNLQDLISMVSSKDIDVIYLGTDLCSGKMLKLPLLLKKAFNIPTISMLAGDGSSHYSLLRQLNTDQKVSGNPSGMTCYRALQALFDDKEEDGKKMSGSGKTSKRQSSSIKVSGGKSLKEKMIMQKSKRSQMNKANEEVKKQLLKLSQDTENSEDKSSKPNLNGEVEKDDKNMNPKIQSSPGKDQGNHSGAIVSNKKTDSSTAHETGSKNKTSMAGLTEKESETKGSSNVNTGKTLKKSEEVSSFEENELDKPVSAQAENDSGENLKAVNEGASPAVESSLSTESSGVSNESSGIAQKQIDNQSMLSDVPDKNNSSTMKSTQKEEESSMKKEDGSQEEPSQVTKEEVTKEADSKRSVEAELFKGADEPCLYALFYKEEDKNYFAFLRAPNKLSEELIDIQSDESRKFFSQIVSSKVNFMMKVEYISVIENIPKEKVNSNLINIDNLDYELIYLPDVESVVTPKVMNEQIACIQIKTLPVDLSLSFDLYIYLEKSLRYYYYLKKGNSISKGRKHRLLKKCENIYINTHEISAYYRDIMSSIINKVIISNESKAA